MARGQLKNLIEYLHQLADPASAGQPTDGELLQRFAYQGDEAAFRTLMQRHGPMVLATCRRILRDVHEAEDGFQATFLVLARKACSVVKHGSLGSWLYRVAYHIAINARARAAKQRAREREVANMPRAVKMASEAGGELAQLLDEELRQLPEKYRAPLVLCYLEGKTYEEAARELSWPTGTMSRRLGRGQELLHRRLVRRGLTLSMAALGQALAAHASAAAVPAALLDATTSAAVLCTGLKGSTAAVASAKVATLVEEALRAMTLAKVKVAALVLVAVGLASTGAALMWHDREQAAPTASSVRVDEPAPEWGVPVHGVRLGCGCDRAAYRLDKDLIRVTFALQNVSAASQQVTLVREGQEFTDVRLVSPDGKEHFVAGSETPLPKREVWGGWLQPNATERVSTILDPSRIDGGLQPGRYRVRGLFRRQPVNDSLTVAGLRLESNETLFTLLPTNPTADDSAATGEKAGGCSLSLDLLDGRADWKPGEPPLAFAVVLNRLDGDLRTLRFLEDNQLGMYYRLEVTPQRGPSSWGLQLAESAGMFPSAHRFGAQRRLMFLQLEQIPIGKSLGERLEWDPGLVPGQHGNRREAVLCHHVQGGPGRYTIRAVYQLSDKDQTRFGANPAAIRLVSNPVEVQITE
jgi:RNA polymerase sigma factor (sigma-70 family)